jgi:methylmalonyl-CoA mutase C-terminal domain/subunit
VIRVLLTIPGLGTHDAGAKRVAKACRDAGMEVVFLSYRGITLEHIASAAEQEDVDVIGLSIHSGAHLSILSELMPLLAKRGLQDLPVVMGGTINPRDIPRLKELGAREVFGPGTPTAKIAEFIKAAAEEKEGAAQHG